jgi:hypothetical protein
MPDTGVVPVPGTCTIAVSRDPSSALLSSISYKKKQRRPPHRQAKSKTKKRGKNQSPGNRKACHSVSTALLKSVAEIEIQSAMKSSRNTLHELKKHIPQKTLKLSSQVIYNTLFP